MRHTLAALVLIAGSATGADKVLMHTYSQGFQHPVVARGKAGELGLAEQTVIEIGKKIGIEVTVSKDGADLSLAKLKQYQGVLFYTQGELDKQGKFEVGSPVKAEDKSAILEYVKAGGGFVGTHCGGADTYHGYQEGNEKPFLHMVGGEFAGHGAQQVTKLEVVDPTFPAVAHLPKFVELNDEWYTYRGFHANMRVLIMIHTEGMKGPLYERPSYPITWCSTFGSGRVFYTGLGHREDVWTNPQYQQMVQKALEWSLKKIDGNSASNLKEIFGDVEKGLVLINTQGKSK